MNNTANWWMCISETLQCYVMAVTESNPERNSLTNCTWNNLKMTLLKNYWIVWHVMAELFLASAKECRKRRIVHLLPHSFALLTCRNIQLSTKHWMQCMGDFYVRPRGCMWSMIADQCCYRYWNISVVSFITDNNNNNICGYFLLPCVTYLILRAYKV